MRRSWSGDGYMSCFRFRNGTVDYRGRYVKTERYQRQVAARRQLYGRYRNPMTDDPSVRDLEKPWSPHLGQDRPGDPGRGAMRPREEGLPYEIDPNTLETLGERDFGDAWGSQTLQRPSEARPADRRDVCVRL